MICFTKDPNLKFFLGGGRGGGGKVAAEGGASVNELF